MTVTHAYRTNCSNACDQMCDPDWNLILKTPKTLSSLFIGLVAAAVIFSGTMPAYAENGDDNTETPGTQPLNSERREATEFDSMIGTAAFPRAGGEDAASIAAAPFHAEVVAHYAHESSGYASGHVTWILHSGATRKLKVTSTLMARTSWFTFTKRGNTVSNVVSPGGGRGKAAVAKVKCTSDDPRDWYTYGEIFSDAKGKSFGWHSSDAQSIPCQ